MKYTDAMLMKYACPMADTVIKNIKAKFEAELEKLLENDYMQVSTIKQLDLSSSYFQVALMDEKEDVKILCTTDSFALNIVGPLDKEPNIVLDADVANTFASLHRQLNQKNKETSFAFKKIARIIKHIHADMVDANIEPAAKVDGYVIINVLATLANDKYTQFNTLKEKLQYVLLEVDKVFNKFSKDDENIANCRKLFAAMHEFVELD